MQTLWLSPTEFVTGDPSLRLSYPYISHSYAIVTCTSPGDFKWIFMGLWLPENVAIEEIIVCYHISIQQTQQNQLSFISQIRLTEMMTPDKAIIIHDDGTGLKDTSPTCYTSHVDGKVPSAGSTITLALRLNFKNTTDKIMLGAIGVKVLSTIQNYYVNVMDFGAKGDTKSVSDGEIAAGTKTLTSVTANFSLSDVGKVVSVKGAEAGRVLLSTTIANFDSPTKVFLEAEASTSVSSANVTWGTDDSSAIQKAFDAGTCIIFPSGTYICKEVSIQSNKTIEGLGDVILKHPDGQSGNILASSTYATKGSIIAGSRSLTVDSSLGFNEGAVCTILGAGGGHMTQENVLVVDLGASGTTLDVGTTSHFPGSGVLVVESELILYTGTTVNSFTGCSRGEFGTVATSHPVGTPIRLSKYLVTTIENISGTDVTVKDPAFLTVFNAPVVVGALRIAIRHLEFDGNKGANSPFNTFCVLFKGTRFFTIEECIIKNADHGGIFVTLSRDGLISDNYLSDNGQPILQLGANIWVFSNCHNIKIARNIIGGGSTIGIAIDDRSTTAHYGVGPCTDCIIDSNLIDGKGEEGLSIAIVVVGSSTNSVINNQILNCQIGISIGENQGVPISEPCTNNLVSFNVFSGCSTGISAASGSSNPICNNKMIGCENIISPGLNPHYNNGIQTNFRIGTAESARK
jgi:parallel beta-helix repeat protein